MRGRDYFIRSGLMVIFLAVLSSCSVKVNLTQSQRVAKETEKFYRFKSDNAQRRFGNVVGYIGYSMAAYRNKQLKNK